MSKANQSLRDELTEKRITFWQLADVVGVHESTIIRWMRIPLSPEHEQVVNVAMEKIISERNRG